MEACINLIIQRNGLKYTKNYATEKTAIRQVEFLLKGFEGQYSYTLIVIESRIVPVIRWKEKFQHNMGISVNLHLFTTN